ncbi:MAG: hypothetical protein P1P90_03070 [Patescibacteria group bacterium]|nr:hypothetical protein [Patescibacteria group bacterium]
MLRSTNPWLEIAKERVRIHDMSPFGVFLSKIKGLGSYASRALVQRGIVFSGYEDERSRSNIVANHKFLKYHAGIGAQELVLVRGNNLARALIEQDQALGCMEMIRQAVHSGMPLDFYLTRYMEYFVEKLGLGWHQISTAQPTIADMFDDKYRLRCLGDELNMRRAFSPWELVSAEFESVMQARERVLLEANAVVPTDIVYLKVHDYDGGVGIMRLNKDTPDDELREFLDEYRGCSLVMDAGYPADSFDTEICSVKIVFDDNGWTPLYFTKMSIQNDAHNGNSVAIGQQVLDPHVERQVVEIVTPFNNAAHENGYGALMPRTACIDFLKVNYEGNVHIFLLEYNARSSASDYAMAVCYEAMHRFGGGKAAVMMENLDGLPEDLSFDELTYNYLNCRPWDGGSRPGFVLANAGCLEQGKITAFTIAPQLSEAEAMMKSIVPKTSVRQKVLLRASA